MKTFKDLKFTKAPYDYPIGLCFFENGYGIRVVHKPEPGTDNDLIYECTLLKGDENDYTDIYNSPLEKDFRYYQITKAEVTELMKKAQEL